MLGTYALSSGYYDAYYGKAQRVRTVIKREHDALFERFDVLISPTSPTVAFELGAKTGNPLAMYLNDLLTIPSCMAGLPGLNIPCGLSEGLPVGLQLVGAAVRREHALPRRPRARGARSASTSSRSGCGESRREPLGAGDRPRDPRPAEDRDEDVLPLPQPLRRRAEHERLPGLPRVSRARCRSPNRRAIEECIKLGLALDCEIAERAVFHRKNYFYPDLPKAYQISQYDEPLCFGGQLAVPTADGEVTIGITRAHLEEDAAKNVHVATSGRLDGATATLVDFNRGGTPLVEIVTEPDLHDAETAKRFLQLLRQTVVELGLSDAELDKGSMRFDINVSVRPAGTSELRTRTELKNMNSFSFAAKGIEREIARQIRIYEEGGTVDQETLHFDPGNEESAPSRSKEEAQDYRYFPEPDLVPVHPPAELVERLRSEIGELPGARIARIATALSFYDADVLVTGGLDALWAALVGAGVDAKEAANVLANQFVATGIDPSSVDASELAKLVAARSEIPRAVFDEALGKVGDDGFEAEPVRRPEGGLRRVGDRPGDRRG